MVLALALPVLVFALPVPTEERLPAIVGNVTAPWTNGVVISCPR